MHRYKQCAPKLNATMGALTCRYMEGGTETARLWGEWNNSVMGQRCAKMGINKD